MSDKPTGSDDSHQELQEEVQDYLDMLLTQATEKPEAQVSQQSAVDKQQATHSEQPADAEQTAVIGKASPSLKMIGGTAVRAVSHAPAVKRPVPKERRQETPPRTEDSRPYAEPVKPIPLKWPLTEAKTAPLETPAPVENRTEVKVETEVKVDVEPRQQPAPVIPPAPEAKTTAEPVEPVAEPEDVVEQDAAVEEDTAVEEELSTSVWMDNGRPNWAQSPFECLLFSVGGLTLAVPLVELGTIFPMSEEITPLFGQIDWFMGLLPVKNGNIKTVNTAKVVMPERYREEMTERFAYVISINGVDWGLAVDNVSNAITLDPSDVRWRSERSKRPWLAGTVIEHMCALLDVSQLAAMFHHQDRSLRR